MLIHGHRRLEGGARESSSARRSSASSLTPPELFLDRYPHELSGGQRQRVAIAASLVLEPELLVADEPVSMLDVSVRAGVLTCSTDSDRSGLGILMITHDLSTAAHYADRIAVMYLGPDRRGWPGRRGRREPAAPVHQGAALRGAAARPARPQRPQILAGEAPDATRIPSGCRFHPRCPVAIEECRMHDPELLRPRNAVSPDHRAACILA